MDVVDIYYALTVDDGEPIMAYATVRPRGDRPIDILQIKNAVKVSHANALSTIDASDLNVSTNGGQVLSNLDAWDSGTDGFDSVYPLLIKTVRTQPAGTSCRGNPTLDALVSRHVMATNWFPFLRHL
jgi:hypothetical protein